MRAASGPAHCPVLIIGAGPFGLSLSADVQSRGIRALVVGRPFEFWKSNMPKGMYVRSGPDWHLDPLGEFTIERYLASRNLPQERSTPLSLATYLDYAEWFRSSRRIMPLPQYVDRLDRHGSNSTGFTATLDDGRTIEAENVVLALGFRYFRHIPQELSHLFPPGRFSHTCDLVDFGGLSKKRVLIVGGRQSAYEWAALLHEAGANRVDIVHRHDRPQFAESDWSWVGPLVNRMAQDPAWFRNLSPRDRESLNARMFAEGRLKLEPWLAPRIANDRVRVWPQDRVVACSPEADGSLRIALASGSRFPVDHVVLATGYKANVANVPFLAAGNLLDSLQVREGHPVLSPHFETSVPGLFATSFLATRAFGMFFAFTVTARATAQIVGSALERRLGGFDRSRIPEKDPAPAGTRGTNAGPFRTLDPSAET